jgi:hypothetical protein
VHLHTGGESGRFGAKGSGYNKFGRFVLEGAAWVAGEGFEVDFYKTYTGEPAPDDPPPKKNPKGARLGARVRGPSWEGVGPNRRARKTF